MMVEVVLTARVLEKQGGWVVRCWVMEVVGLGSGRGGQFFHPWWREGRAETGKGGGALGLWALEWEMGDGRWETGKGRLERGKGYDIVRGCAFTHP